MHPRDGALQLEFPQNLAFTAYHAEIGYEKAQGAGHRVCHCTLYYRVVPSHELEVICQTTELC